MIRRGIIRMGRKRIQKLGDRSFPYIQGTFWHITSRLQGGRHRTRQKLHHMNTNYKCKLQLNRNRERITLREPARGCGRGGRQGKANACWEVKKDVQCRGRSGARVPEAAGRTSRLDVLLVIWRSVAFLILVESPGGSQVTISCQVCLKVMYGVSGWY